MTNTNVPKNVIDMLMKLRKGSHAWIKAKLLSEIFTYMQGWSIIKTKVEKPSNGGWLLDEIPGYLFCKTYKNDGGRIFYEAHVLEDETNEHYNENHRAEDEAKVEFLKTVIFSKLQKMENENGKKFNIRNVEMNEYVEGRFRNVEISFEFLVKMNAFQITSPDGQVYEVYGDYKNGAADPHTFSDFYAWAVENTDFMDQCLTLLGMEPFEKKYDPSKQYIPPKTSSKETIEIFDLLKTMTNDIRDQQISSMRDWMETLITRFLDASENDKTLAKNMLASSGAIIYRVWSPREGIEENWKEIIEDIATKNVELMQNEFVYKNTHKLSSIVSAKGNCIEKKVVSLKVSGAGSIVGRLHFEFADGSSFDVDNSTVLSFSVYGKAFNRFPTTFHNVKLPDGRYMPQPSEQRMNEVFVKM